MAETEIERVTLITLHQEETVELAGGRVRIVPAWRWYLEPPED